MRTRWSAATVLVLLATLALRQRAAAAVTRASGDSTTVGQSPRRPSRRPPRRRDSEKTGQTGKGNLVVTDCAELASIGAKFSAAFGGTVRTDSEATTAFFPELVDKAPDEIKDDSRPLRPRGEAPR